MSPIESWWFAFFLGFIAGLVVYGIGGLIRLFWEDAVNKETTRRAGGRVR